MPRRVSIALWLSTGVATLALGSLVASVRALLAASSAGPLVTFIVSAALLAGSLIVASRVVWMTTRAARDPSLPAEIEGVDRGPR